MYLLLRWSRLYWDWSRPELKCKKKVNPPCGFIILTKFFTCIPHEITHSSWWVRCRRQWLNMILYHTRGDDLRGRECCHVLEGFVFRCLILQVDAEHSETRGSTTRWQRVTVLCSDIRAAFGLKQRGEERNQAAQIWLHCRSVC